jgi:hypothetical protein
VVAVPVVFSCRGVVVSWFAVHYRWESRIEKPVGFYENRRNRFGSVSLVFDKPASESIFLKKKLIFLKKWFIDFDTGLPVVPTGLSVSVDFNHCRPTSLSISVPVYRSHRSVNRSYWAVYRISISQMRNLNLERFLTDFISFYGNWWWAIFKTIPIFQSGKNSTHQACGPLAARAHSHGLAWVRWLVLKISGGYRQLFFLKKCWFVTSK